MTLQIKTEFAEIYSHFYHENHTLQDISDIVALVDAYKKKLTWIERKTLLEIPKNVLHKQVTIPDVDNWRRDNAYYFSGNHEQEPFHSKFKNKDYDLSTIALELEEIMLSANCSEYPYALRNAETVLRDDAVLKNKTQFTACGRIYYEQMKKAFELSE